MAAPEPITEPYGKAEIHSGAGKKEELSVTECRTYDELERLQNKWPGLVENIGKEHPVIRTDLLDSWPEGLTDTTCVIGFDPEFAGEISEVKRLGYDTVHRAVVDELKRSVRLEFVKATQAVRWSHQLKHPAPSHTVPTVSLRSWESNPAVRQVLEVFHGDVRDVQK